MEFTVRFAADDASTVELQPGDLE
jgi:hypothetical protein